LPNEAEVITCCAETQWRNKKKKGNKKYFLAAVLPRLRVRKQQ